MPLYIYGPISTIVPTPIYTATIDTNFVDITSGLKHWYQFESTDTSGTTILNYANNTYDAKYKNNAVSTTSTSAVGNSSVYLPSQTAGPYNYVEVDTTKTTFNLGAGAINCAISVWFNITDLSLANFNYPFLFAIYSATSTNRLLLSLNSNASPWTSWQFYHSNTSATINGSSDSQDKGTWYHAVCDICNGTLYQYFNNVQKFTGTLGPAIDQSMNIHVIGVYQNPSNSTFAEQVYGYMDDYRVYNRGLNAAQIAALYNLRKSGGSAASISTYSVTRTGTNFTINWTGTGVACITLSNLTQSINYGRFTTSGQTYTGINWTNTDKFYITPYNSTNPATALAGLATAYFTIS